VAGKKRVLLVEDHALLRSVLAMRLNLEQDLEVTALCGSLADARNVDLQECDAAIVDIFLPDGNGTELIRALRSTVPRSIPTIALTDLRDPRARAEARGAGANEVLPVSAGFDEVLAALRRVLGDA
jgi:DNA-binding NarL/FixJ family response regulator